ncbi:MAG: hypothetical protein NTY04_01210, partial [Candidatus Staskawiczbacteria bacterium]|nr:hypothetical protein [Candidatus Staskawiczbacteria bacterium]
MEEQENENLREQELRIRDIKKEKRVVLFSLLAVLLIIFLGTTAGTFAPKIPQDKVIKGVALKQEQIVAGHSVAWLTLIKNKDLSDGKHLVKLPKGATDIKINTISSAQAEGILLSKPKEQLSLAQRQQLAMATTEKSENILAQMTGFLYADVSGAIGNAAQNIINSFINQKIILTPDATYIDVSKDDLSISFSKITSSFKDAIAFNSSAPVPDYLVIKYNIPGPKLVSQTTNTGQQVTISAPKGYDDKDSMTPMVNVLAPFKIPKKFKVGEESKIHIEWKNPDCNVATDILLCRSKGIVEMPFKAYDTDNDGYLDYVEWTVPHLSDQVFDIIFISKAFQLDSNQNILADVYTETATQDNVWTSLTTIYAKAVDSNKPATIEVYPAYTDENGTVTDGPLVATFNNINTQNTYKVFLTSLQKPTDLFDLKIIGNVDIDYVVDPVGAVVQYITSGHDFG